MMSIGPCLYGFTLNRAREEAVLVHILHSHKKIRFLYKNPCGRYEYFEDSLVLYLHISCFDLTVAL